MPRQQILLSNLSEGPKVEESQIIGMESNFVFLQRPKPEFVNITGTKKGISPLMFAYMICP